jgi:hypothetical protein
MDAPACEEPSVCKQSFAAIKLVKYLREAGCTLGSDTLTAAFYVCNRGLKKLR